ncbi:MAG: type II/IV secretion system protein [Planctomycetes bacterium]|nr:type II/IV secretion system protein [Planctomycetota bacterium]
MTARQTLEDGLRAAGLGDADLDKARSYASSKGATLERAVVALGMLDEDRVYRCVAKTAGLPFVDPGKAKLEDDVVGRVPRDQIEQSGALPVLIRDGVLYVAIDDPLKTYVADNFAFFAGCDVRCAIAPPGRLKEAIRRIVAGGGAAATPRGKADARADSGDPDAPIIRLVEETISRAIEERASDIHIEPYEHRVRVRFRVDGVLRDHESLDRALHGPLTSRLKIMASMDIAERRKPQDGRIDFRRGGRAIDIRASVLPSSHGETVVMRLLDKDQGLRSLEALGFEGEDRRRFSETIKRPNGIVLVTGPTGSGKTTTLYAALRELNRPDVKIITAEDPVEFNIAGINQCQARSAIGLDFARILRAMLRQAPNIILVGEIRDRETAEIAVQAALTGHLVFSTLHTNDAPSAITRLVDMGVKPFLASAAVQAVMAQRLIRVLCTECRRLEPATESELRTLGLDAAKTGAIEVGRAVGCPRCEGTGFRGRIGIFELMILNPTLREAIFGGTSTESLRNLAITGAGMRSLFQDGVRKVLDGVTTVDELLRVTASG